jgi:hypothetical protein
LTVLRLTLSACLMGGGIFTMHYIGMSALDASTYMVHDRVFVAASMAIAIAASGLALWLATGRGGRPPLILSATAFGIAVSGMHYTAMTGVTLYPFVTAPSGAPALSSDLLAIVVAVVAFCVSGIFLLVLLPDSSREPTPVIAAAAGEAAGVPLAGATAAGIRVETAAGGSAAGVNAPADAETPEYGQGSYGPLGGAGRPPRRYARHLPIERDGGTRFVAVEDVVAIHANAHYTTIFDGNDKLFCPLAIGDVETRLDHERFVRVHRSHIVNIDRVVGYKRCGDNDMLELAGVGHYAVPVSRSRVGSLKSRIASATGADRASLLRRRLHRFAPQ